MNDLKDRLLSRKFLLAVGTFLVFIANEQYTEAMGVVIAYFGVNAATEITGRVTEPKSE